MSTVDADNGEVDVDLSRVQAGEEVTITATPDEGYEVEAVTVTDRDGEEINVTEAGDGVYTFEMPDSRVTIEVTFAPVAEEPEPPAVPDGWANPYGDVAANAWYYDAVAYVSASGMMTGTNAAAFSPDAATTRAMIWTVLARLNGQSVDGEKPLVRRRPVLGRERRRLRRHGPSREHYPGGAGCHAVPCGGQSRRQRELPGLL